MIKIPNMYLQIFYYRPTLSLWVIYFSGFYGIAVVFLQPVASSLCVLCSTPAVLIRIRVEEKILLTHFGEDYKKYKKETKALLPLVY